MADNYLERRMDDYRNGRMTPPARSGVRRSAPASGQTLRFTPRNAVVADTGDDAITAAVVHALRGAGCRVSFGMADNNRGNRLAQQSGARYYPAGLFDRAIDDMRPCGIILDSSLTLTVNRDGITTVNALRPRTGATPDDIAGVCLLLASDAAACLNGESLAVCPTRRCDNTADHLISPVT